MRLTRCHIEAPLAVGALVPLTEAITTHLTRVLRLGPGARIVLFNGDGCDYEAELSSIERRGAVAEVLASTPVQRESPLPLVLAQAVARGEKMDWVLQKATELGATAFVPLLTERSEVKLDAERGGKRLAHWRAVIASACEQCGRARLPAIAAPLALADWLTAPARAALDEAHAARQLPLIYLDPEAEASINQLPPEAQRGACFVIGPEGGLGERDLAQLRGTGAIGLRLGPRVLRTETAGLALLAAMQARYGDF